MSTTDRLRLSGAPTRPLRDAAAMLVLAATLAPPLAHAAIGYTISFDDPTGAAGGLYGQIDSQVGAALSLWSTVLTGSSSFQVQVEITDGIARAGGSSATAGYVGVAGPLQIYEQGLAYKLRTGIDANGALPDMRLLINADYLKNELWFDPTPLQRTTPVDPARTDATSVFVHEFGHALAFNGWGDLVTGAVAGGYASPFDLRTTFDGATLFFTGAAAQSVYGGPIPLTEGNNFHLGNAGGTGSNLLGDVMNGVTFERGIRYGISELDVAMMRDMGVGVIPEAPAWLMWLCALSTLSLLALRRRSGALS